MALYVIGDLHLSLESDKPMDAFGQGWDDYVNRIKAGFEKLTPDDVCVLCGDLSWASSLKTSVSDFRFISNLPGKKIALKGNHDHWWSTIAKMDAFFALHDLSGIQILSNNCFYYGDMAICGSRGWTIENKADAARNDMMVRREANRLNLSLEAAGDATEKLCFLHYPPIFRGLRCRELIDVMLAHGVRRCWYGHIHGYGHNYAVQGCVDGIDYRMISADYINFTPQKICD
ncbi:MAG: metallophosphoesterase [Oscillospiraceae bacterium]|jgi:predicted phosphohydrolase|nr:metallophosphoesterase [Oscillospiraceae bacterium]